MLIRKLKDQTEIVAGDGTRLRELLHPDRDYPFSGRYSLAHAVVPAGEKSLKHRLRTDEVYYILSGTGLMHLDEESAEVTAGDLVDIPPGTVQWLENNSGQSLEFLCIVDPAWQSADEEVLE
ncbi:MAG: cupin domain-containing protein [bacterium]|nr:cupin domain-containing protein [bacterium]